MQNEIIFHQLFEKESSTYTYFLGDPRSKEAIIIDPVIEMADRDVQLLKDLGLNLKYVLDTHVHADHITASGELRKRTGAKVGIGSAYDLSCPDLHIEDGQELFFGDYKIEALHTPGHTSGCTSYKILNMIFTGDALLVRGCGRTDFQDGSAEKLFCSVREKLFNLADDTIVFPAHDYKGFTRTSIGLEKSLNPRLNMLISKDQFIEIMGALKLSYPVKIKAAVPANLQCGLPLKSEILNSGNADQPPTVTPEDLLTKLGQLKVIDVRGLDEFNNELGHIATAELATLGQVLSDRISEMDRDNEIIFVCRSGKRSAEATKLAISLGFKRAYNLDGGMLKWNELRFPFERDRGGS